MPVLLVMLGGALGSGARYLVGRGALAWLGPAFPWGTLAVNVIGGFAMGLLFGLTSRATADDPWRLFLGVGFLGGFTTFSAFSLEMIALAERGQPGLAIGYAALSVGGAAAALVAGVELARVAA